MTRSNHQARAWAAFLCALMVTKILAADTDLQKRMNAIFLSPSTARAEWSCLVQESKKNQPIYALHPDTSRIPASNQKLFTAAAILFKYGLKTRLQQRVLVSGTVQHGVLNGNLILPAEGRIIFSARYPKNASIAEKQHLLDLQIDSLVQALHQRGIQQINGYLTSDPNQWNAHRRNPHYPCAGGLSFNENTLDIDVRDHIISHCPRRLISFSLFPKPGKGKQRRNPGPQNDRDRIQVNPNQNSHDYWRLQGLDPVTYTLSQLYSELAQRGLKINRGIQLGPQPDDARPLFSLAGLSIAELLAPMLTWSDNFRAETLYFTLGQAEFGEATYAHAATAVTKILTQHGISLEKTTLADGSGLSHNNRTTARTLVQLLNTLDQHPDGQAFRSFLAVSGLSGTLRHHLRDPDLKGHVQAKTGTLNGVKTLSGFLLRPDGRQLTFSFLCNHAPGATVMWQTFSAALHQLLRTPLPE